MTMCIVITQDGTEVICPDEVYLDSNNIRRTMRFLMAQSLAYKQERQAKREARAKAKKPFWKR